MRWYYLNQDKVKAWRQANRERLHAECAAWAKANPDKKKASLRKWREKNRKRLSEYSCAWAKANPEKHRANNRRQKAKNRVSAANDTAERRARLKGVGGGGITKAEWAEICETFGNVCAYCLKPKKLTRDHVVPITKGGRDEYANIVPACQSCNSSKHNRMVAVFYCERFT